MRRPLAVVALGFTTFLGACASGNGGAMGSTMASNSFAAASTARVGRGLVSATELVSTKAQDVYHALIQLRPEYLRGRGAASINMRSQTEVVVYIDNVKAGGPETLQGFPLAGVASIQYLSAADATMRWGLGHSGGVILINTMR